MLFLIALHPDKSLASKRGTERGVRETTVKIQYFKRCFMTTGRTVFSFFNFSIDPAWVLPIPRNILKSKRPIYMAWQLTLSVEPHCMVKEVLVILLMEDILLQSIGNLIHYQYDPCIMYRIFPYKSTKCRQKIPHMDPMGYLLSAWRSNHQLPSLRRGSSISQTSLFSRWGWAECRRWWNVFHEIGSLT